jgi:hypothetical protein
MDKVLKERMMLVESLLVGWEKNLGYAQRLVGDLTERQMIHQPSPGMNHPAWVFSHLNAYHPVLAGMLRGEAFEDPKNHPFGMNSAPAADASLYAKKEALLKSFVSGHERVAEALKGADLGAAMPLERWRKPFPTVAAALGYLMLVHESTHLGQISAWRRVQGLASV